MDWAIEYLSYPLRVRKQFYRALVRQARAAGERRIISFRQFERMARDAARIRVGPAGNLSL